MSDRLAELLRQRALAQEQLAWFDREIARERGETPPVPAIAATPSTPVPVIVPAPAMPEATTQQEVDRTAEEILQRFKHVEHPVRDDVRRGCLLYFFSALALVGLGVALLYFLHLQKEL